MDRNPFYGMEIRADETVPSNINFDGHVEFQAAESDDKPNRFLLIANSGRPMNVEGFFDPVLVDISGAKFDKKKTPVIADHDTTKRIGHTEEQSVIPVGGDTKLNGKSIKGPKIAASGIVSSSTGTARGFVEDSKRGFPFQVSIGAKIIKGEFVDEGDSIEVNGKTWKGPLIVSHQTLIRELSVTVLGADNNTSANIAARKKETATMSFEAFVESLGLDINALSDEQKENIRAVWQSQHGKSHNPGNNGNNNPNNTPGNNGPGQSGNPETPPIQAMDPAQFREKVAAEESRMDSIRNIATRYAGQTGIKLEGDDTEYTTDSLKAKAIKEGWTPEQMELPLLRAARPSQSPAAPAFHIKDNQIQSRALEAAILRETGTPMKAKNPVNGIEYGVETMFDAKTLEESERPQYRFGGSIQSLLDIQIRAAGNYYPGTNRGDSDFVRAAVNSWNSIKASGFSTLNIPNVLENTMHKASLASFNSVEAVWRFICGRRSLSDFRPHNLYRLSMDGSFRQVSPDGELKHVSMTDEKFSIQADTFGAMITIGRKTIKNDDLGVVLDKARGIGMLGAQRIEESVMVLLLSNPSSFFAAGNNNLLTGAGSALGIDSLDDARELFRNHTINGKPISVSPRILLVPTTLETTATRLWEQETVENVGSTDATKFHNNPHVGLYRPYVTPYLNNTSITDQDGSALSGQSDTQWYLFGDPNSPQGSALVIGFMDGRDTPFFDSAETDFNVPGGMQFRSFLDWGVAMHVTQLGVKSAGA